MESISAKVVTHELGLGIEPYVKRSVMFVGKFELNPYEIPV